jgi:hypothetical protein
LAWPSNTWITRVSTFCQRRDLEWPVKVESGN